ncbi:unnamed protein product [Gongylonema pulchrum]|uniref:C2H2-type domain-containing protein n=1 Tax=Gongylonema pulchrum TaxID=637853 RepID=A0A183EBF9_9BILA|nr:unnamed protein product [Gongylonema pulchrum]
MQKASMESAGDHHDFAPQQQQQQDSQTDASQNPTTGPAAAAEDSFPPADLKEVSSTPAAASEETEQCSPVVPAQDSTVKPVLNGTETEKTTPCLEKTPPPLPVSEETANAPDSITELAPAFENAEAERGQLKDENGFIFYKCRFCGLTYNYLTTLRAHERVHNIDEVAS